MFNWFKKKKAQAVVEPAQMRKYKVHGKTAYGSDCMLEVMARSREEAAKKALGPANEARKYTKNDDRDYSIYVAYVRYVTPV